MTFEIEKLNKNDIILVKVPYNKYSAEEINDALIHIDKECKAKNISAIFIPDDFSTVTVKTKEQLYQKIKEYLDDCKSNSMSTM